MLVLLFKKEKKKKTLYLLIFDGFKAIDRHALICCNKLKFVTIIYFSNFIVIMVLEYTRRFKKSS